MTLYPIIAALVGVIAGLVIAIKAKKAENTVYGKLDLLGRITNVLLLVLYTCLSAPVIFLGMICYPAYDGFLGIIGWIVTIICASAVLFCALGLGFSVSLRKKGKRILSFVVQFAGVGAILLTVLCYALFAGNLLESLN